MISRPPIKKQKKTKKKKEKLFEKPQSTFDISLVLVLEDGVVKVKVILCITLIDGSAFCPGVPRRVPSDSEKQLHVYTSSHICHSHEWRVGHSYRQNSQQTKCVLRRLPIGG